MQVKSIRDGSLDSVATRASTEETISHCMVRHRASRGVMTKAYHALQVVGEGPWSFYIAYVQQDTVLDTIFRRPVASQAFFVVSNIFAIKFRRASFRDVRQLTQFLPFS